MKAPRPSPSPSAQGRASVASTQRVRLDEAPSARVAVIVPVRNEAREATALVERLRRLRAGAPGVEVVVVDGESDDGSAELLCRLAPELLVARAPRGRARQMNAGARLAQAPTLLFLHADTVLAPDALARVDEAVARGADFGCFPVEIDSADARLRLASQLINLRSRLLCSATGDQAIFVQRALFEQVGGFPEVELCEDLELVRRLCGRGRYILIDRPVVTSARRWERRGVLRTVALMWSIRAAWHLGVPPGWLARFYREVR